MSKAQKRGDAKPAKPELWQKSSYANLIRYVPSGVFFCRIRVRGVLIRKSLKTDVLSVARLRLADEEKKHRQAADRKVALQRGSKRMNFGDALELYRERLKNNAEIIEEYIQQVAIHRLALDNITHHRAVWRTMGYQTAARALRSGADDLCGTGSINAVDSVLETHA